MKPQCDISVNTVNKMYKYIKNGMSVETFMCKFNLNINEVRGIVELCNLYGKNVIIDYEDDVLVFKKNISKKTDIFDGLKEEKGIKEATIIINRSKINVAVVEQMENLETIIRNNYYKNYHLIEVMNCKSGCIGGGGQPLTNIDDIDNTRNGS